MSMKVSFSDQKKTEKMVVETKCATPSKNASGRRQSVVSVWIISLRFSIVSLCFIIFNSSFLHFFVAFLQYVSFYLKDFFCRNKIPRIFSVKTYLQLNFVLVFQTHCIEYFSIFLLRCFF